MTNASWENAMKWANLLSEFSKERYRVKAFRVQMSDGSTRFVYNLMRTRKEQ